MKTLSKVMIALMAMLMMVPMGVTAQKKEKKKKEKKAYEWKMPEQLSGDATIDEYLLSCDTLWNKVQSYTENMTTYIYKVDTLWNVNGAHYIMAHMETTGGQYLTRSAANWQLVEAITTGAEIVLDATNIGLQTASATMSLPNLGLKALSYAKYVKAGPNIIAKAGKEIKELASFRRSQWQSWKAMKTDAVDASTLGLWNEEQLKALEKCCFIKKLDTTTARELTPEELAAQEQLTGGLNITVAPEVEGQTLDNEPDDLDALMEAEGEA